MVSSKNTGVAQVYIGVDPGVGGGLAALDGDGCLIDAIRMPERTLALLAWLQRHAKGATALLEFVRSSPQMGRASCFTFGRGYGRLETALDAAGIPFGEIVPAKWQGIMGCRTGGDKNVTKAFAAARWPGYKVTHAIADALILAECCRLLEARQRAATVRGFK